MVGTKLSSGFSAGVMVTASHFPSGLQAGSETVDGFRLASSLLGKVVALRSFLMRFISKIENCNCLLRHNLSLRE
jgi:hypothetical protein